MGRSGWRALCIWMLMILGTASTNMLHASPVSDYSYVYEDRELIFRQHTYEYRNNLFYRYLNLALTTPTRVQLLRFYEAWEPYNRSLPSWGTIRPDDQPLKMYEFLRGMVQSRETLPYFQYYYADEMRLLEYRQRAEERIAAERACNAYLEIVMIPVVKETVTDRIVTVDNTVSEIRFIINGRNWNAMPEVFAPDGSPVSPWTEGAIVQQEPLMLLVVISNPQPGQWLVRLPGGGDGCTYLLRVAAMTGITADPTTDASRSPQTPETAVGLMLQLTDAACSTVTVTSQQVTNWNQLAAGSEYELFPDSDVVGGNHHYGAALDISGGLQLLTYRASGVTADGWPWQRVATQVYTPEQLSLTFGEIQPQGRVEVNPPPISFTGVCQDLTPEFSFTAQLDGVALPASALRVLPADRQNVLDLNYYPAQVLAAGIHNASVVVKNGNELTEVKWEFTIAGSEVAPAGNKLRINEVFAGSSPSGQWVELYCVSGPVDLADRYYLSDRDQYPTAICRNSLTLNAGEYAVVHCLPAGSNDPDDPTLPRSESDTTGDLNNNGVKDLYISRQFDRTDEGLLLMQWDVAQDAVFWANGDGKLVNYEDADVDYGVRRGVWVMPASPQQPEEGCVIIDDLVRSLGRLAADQDNNTDQDWTVQAYPTPGTANVGAYSNDLSVVINEVQAMGEITGEGDWVELYVAKGPSPLHCLELHTLDGNNQPLADEPLIAPTGSYILVHWQETGQSEVDRLGDLNNNNIIDIYLGRPSLLWKAEEVVLSCGQQILDAVVISGGFNGDWQNEWRDAQYLVEQGAWHGTYAEHAPFDGVEVLTENQTIGRYPSGTDNNQRDDWSVMYTPTPGRANVRTRVPAAGEVLINEVLPNTVAGRDHDWAELYCANGPVDIGPLVLNDADGPEERLADGAVTLQTGEYVVVHWDGVSGGDETDDAPDANHNGHRDLYVGGQQLFRTDDQLELKLGTTVLDAVYWSDGDGSLPRSERGDIESILAAGAWQADGAVAGQQAAVDLQAGYHSIGRMPNGRDTNHRRDWQIVALTPGAANDTQADGMAPSSWLTIEGITYQSATETWIVPVTRLRINALDDQSGVEHIEYSVDMGGITLYAEPFTIATEGGHQVNWTVFDADGNLSTGTARVGVDAQPPVIVANSPADEANYRFSSPVAVDISAYDSGVGTASLTVVLDGIPIDPTVTQLDSRVAAGEHQIAVTAADHLGNERQYMIAFVMIDDLPPAPPILADPPAISAAEEITLTGTAEYGSLVTVYDAATNQPYGTVRSGTAESLSAAAAAHAGLARFGDELHFARTYVELLHDTFAEAADPLWESYFGDTGMVRDGKLWVEGGALFAPELRNADLTLEAAIITEKFLNGETKGNGAVEFVTDDRGRMKFEYNPAWDNVQLVQCNPNGVLVAAGMKVTDLNENHRLRLSVNGSRYRGWIDGMQVVDHTDAASSFVTPMLESWNARIGFDDVVVSSGEAEGTAYWPVRLDRPLLGAEFVTTGDARLLQHDYALLTQGLRGEYFNGHAFRTVVSERIDQDMGGKWFGTASPAPGIRPDGFAVRWTGYIYAPVSGEYRFWTHSDDGHALWINGQLLNYNLSSSPQSSSSAIVLEGGRFYPITMILTEGGGDAWIQLFWLKPGDGSAQRVTGNFFYTAADGFSPLAELKPQAATGGWLLLRNRLQNCAEPERQPAIQSCLLWRTDSFAWTVPLHEGDNSFTATATDAFGNISAYAEPVSVWCDRTLPSVTALVAQPNPFSPMTGNLAAISAMVEDNLPGQLMVEMSISSDTGALYHRIQQESVDQGALSWQWSGRDANGNSLPAGDYLIVVSIADRAGNSARREAMLTLAADMVPPEISVLTPVADGRYSYTTMLTPEWTATDAGAGEVAVQVMLDGVPISAGQSVALRALGLGAHTLLVVATDAAGNRAEAQVSFSVVDDVPPVLTVAAPPLMTNQPVTLAYAAFDELGGEVTVGGDASPYTTEGAHAVTLTATDASGNQATATVNFTIDLTPPAVTLTQPLTPTNQPLTLAYVVSDNFSGSESIVVTGQQNFISEGVYRDIVMQATDAAGNTAVSEPVSFVIDLTPPVVELAVGSPSSGGWLSPHAPLTLTATDSLAGVAEIRYCLDAGDLIVYNGPFTLATAGAHTVTFTATDAAGNSAAEQQRIMQVDDAPPQLTLTCLPLSADSLTAVPESRITLTATDAGAGVELIEYCLNGGEWQVYTASFTLREARIVTEGIVTIAGRATDRVGNAGAEQAHTLQLRQALTVTATKLAAPRVLAWWNEPARRDGGPDAARAALIAALDSVTLDYRLVDDSAAFTAVLRDYNMYLIVGDRALLNAAGESQVAAAVAAGRTLLSFGYEDIRTPEAADAGWVNIFGAKVAGMMNEPVRCDMLPLAPGGAWSATLTGRTERITELTGADVVGTITRLAHDGGERRHEDSCPAVVLGEWGVGRTLLATPSFSENHAVMAGFVAAAVAWGMPEISPAEPGGIAGIDIRVTNAVLPMTLHVYVEAVMPDGGTATTVYDDGEVQVGSVVWTEDLPAGAERQCRFLLRLPEQPGVYRVRVEAAYAADGVYRTVAVSEVTLP